MSPFSHSQPGGNPFQCHRRFFPQTSRYPCLARITFLPPVQLLLCPVQPFQLFGHNPGGLLLAGFPPFRAVMIEPVIRSAGVAFQQLLLLQDGDLAHEAVAIGPAFVGVGQVAKDRAREHVRGPKQEVQEFLSLGLHGGSMEE